MDNQWTILSLLKWMEDYFRQHKIPSPRLDAEILLSYHLDMERIKLYVQFDKVLDPEALSRIKELIKRRVRHEPMAYITGSRDFFGLKFMVNENVLIPRPETEHLAEEVLKHDLAAKSVLDIGTGSGNLAVTIAKYSPGSSVTAVDISEEALETAKGNADRILGNHGIRFVRSDIYSGIEDRFDFIISNPPYIRSQDIPALEETVRDFEPVKALDGGEDGLFFYREIIQGAKDHLNPGGRLFLELNSLLKDKIMAHITANRFELVRIIPDYAGLERVAV
ncbi:MAG: peptide chain release factor N(5)-glutamine methyltransferase, partial [bacterium]|nr:peptide chain release factor N(5)-glutamine methyltransferase [bacterium]